MKRSTDAQAHTVARDKTQGTEASETERKPGPKTSKKEKAVDKRCE